MRAFRSFVVVRFCDLSILAEEHCTYALSSWQSCRFVVRGDHEIHEKSLWACLLKMMSVLDKKLLTSLNNKINAKKIIILLQKNNY